MLQLYKRMLKDFALLKGGTVILYGSVASEKSRPDSDIDIAIISDSSSIREKAEKIADRIFLGEGKAVSIQYFTPQVIKKNRENPFIKKVLSGVVLNGRKIHKAAG